jgi:hypothetical protein
LQPLAPTPPDQLYAGLLPSSNGELVQRAGLVAVAGAGTAAPAVVGSDGQMTGPAGYTIRQAAYDLHKLRGKVLLVKPGRSRRYQVPPQATRTIAGLLTLRAQVIGPILAGVRSPRLGRKPAHWTAVDRDYETSRIGCRPSSPTSASPPAAPQHRQHFVDPDSASA